MAKEKSGQAIAAMVGALTAHGVLSARGQKLVRMQIEKGSVQVAVESVAAVLLRNGMQDQQIPLNAGVRTQELADRVEEAIFHVVDSYHMHGGVLVAKGHASALHLAAEMAKQWINGFSAPDFGEIPQMPPGHQERLTVVAQLAAMHLLDLSGTLSNHGLSLSAENRPAVQQLLGRLLIEPEVITLESDQLETFATRIAAVLYKVLMAPEEEVHKALHGGDA